LLESAVPSIVVTHDRAEAIALGDWLVVMIEGAIRQTGPVRDVFRSPVDAGVAESLGVENILPAEVVGRERGLLTVRVGGVPIECVDSGETGALLACIRAEDVAVTREARLESSARNRIAGTVTAVALEGPVARVEIDCGFPLVAAVTAQSAGDLGLRAGESVCAVVKATSVHLVR
jgi:molybdate transport system ATP-binding protein